jgi:hypothetical protein
VIVRDVTLPLAPDAAFHLFTARIDDWWPPERRHAGPGARVVLTPERFAEERDDGTIVPLGRVREWAPAERLVLDFFPGTGPDDPTEVTVLFVPDETGTRLTVRHGPGGIRPDLWESRAPRYGPSWDLVLAAVCAAGHNA